MDLGGGAHYKTKFVMYYLIQDLTLIIFGLALGIFSGGHNTF